MRDLIMVLIFFLLIGIDLDSEMGLIVAMILTMTLLTIMLITKPNGAEK